jgi:hypothetical protein
MKNKSVALAFALLVISNVVHTQSADPKQIMTQVKQNLNTSMKALAGYTWVETTTIFKGDEAKSQTQNQCKYGPDGKIVKTPIAPAAPSDEKSPRGIRGKVVENKKEEMSGYVKSAVAKVHEYLPPNAEKLQTISASGKMQKQDVEAGKVYKLSFPDYLQAGDALAITIDMAKALMKGINVNTYIDAPADKVVFTITYAQLADGTEYANETVLDLPKEGLKVVIKNEKHQKL